MIRTPVQTPETFDERKAKAIPPLRLLTHIMVALSRVSTSPACHYPQSPCVTDEVKHFTKG